MKIINEIIKDIDNLENKFKSDINTFNKEKKKILH